MAEHEMNGPGLPYASWATCLHLIERMEKEGVPSRIDNTYLIGMSGGTQNQVKHALRALDLIDEDGRTTPRLLALTKEPEQRPQRVAEMLRERFPRMTELSTDATRGEMDEVIREPYGLNGATARKAAAFYLAAATYAGIPLSPHIKPAKPSSGAGGGSSAGRRAGTRRKNAQQRTNDATPVTESSSKSMTERYFDLLLSKAAESGDKDSTDLFNRIERLVGVPPTSNDAPTNGASADKDEAGES